MADVTVCMPWRATPERLAAHDRVRAFWHHHGIPVIEADSTWDEPFSLCHARNKAVHYAITRHVIVADADTIPDIGAVLRATEHAGVTWPFTTYRHIDTAWTDMPDLMSAPYGREYGGSVGGLFVCERELYWHLGGMDERFEPRWGYDDNAFHAVATTLATVRREDARVFSFDHPADRDMSDDNPNKHRYALYRAAQGNPAMMRELIKR